MENETLYKQLRNLPTRKSKKFMEWVKQKHPDKQRHHLLGSMTGIKLNDYLLKPVTHTEHEQAERNKIDFAINNLPQSLNLLFEYIKELEMNYEELEAKCWRLEHENETLKETIDGLNTELDKLSADYNRLLSELDIINQLEK